MATSGPVGKSNLHSTADGLEAERERRFVVHEKSGQNDNYHENGDIPPKAGTHGVSGISMRAAAAAAMAAAGAGGRVSSFLAA